MAVSDFEEMVKERQTISSRLLKPKLNAQKKTEIVLRWLAEFQISTIPILGMRVGANLKSGGFHTFIKRLAEEGILKFLDVPVINNKLVLMTKIGKSLALEFTHKANKSLTDQSKVCVANVRHTLATQMVAIERLEPGITIDQERFLHQEGKGKLPDFILTQSDTIIATEVELHHKNTSRVYFGYMGHVHALGKRRYHRVEYVFNSINLLERYKEKFDEQKWPNYERDNQFKLIKLPIDFEPDLIPGLRKLFRFSYQKMVF